MNTRHVVKLALALVLAVACSASAEDRPIRVACVGDSITAGVGARNRRTQTYPAQLGDILGDGYKVVNFGVSGIMMTSYKRHRNFQKVKDFQPNLTIIKLGTNDTKRRRFRDPKDKARFDASYTAAALEMIKTFRGLQSKPKVYICYPVPVFKSMGAINERSIVEDIVPLVTAVSKKTGTPIIDLYKALKGKGQMVPDGVHPNEHGYKVIAETVARALTGKQASSAGPGGAATEVEQSGSVRHRFMKTGWNSQSIAIVDKDDTIEWELPVGKDCMDAWVLPDGGVVYCGSMRSVVRLGPDKKELWTYKVKAGCNNACQPLPGGGFLLGVNVKADEHYAVEIDSAGRETKRVRLELADCKNLSHTFRQFRKTLGGTYIGVIFHKHMTREWDSEGKLLRTFPSGHFMALRLPSGNTLISGKPKRGKGGFLVEYDRDAKVVWEFTGEDVDRNDLRISMLCGFQVLKNGNIVITNTRHGSGHGARNKFFPHVFEITGDKKELVWQLNTSKWKNVNVIQILDEPGDVHKLELLR
ncbi:MAG: GDSL-type esterase/lipase family protein [Planctomycetota bacterium]|jgi:lysophospholipase L1-like esterase